MNELVVIGIILLAIFDLLIVLLTEGFSLSIICFFKGHDFEYCEDFDSYFCKRCGKNMELIE